MSSFTVNCRVFGKWPVICLLVILVGLEGAPEAFPEDTLTIIPMQIAGDIYSDPGLSAVTGGSTVATFYSFDAPYITPGGNILYLARMAVDPLTAAPFDTFDSIWKATSSTASTPQIQVRLGTEAPLAGWEGNLGLNDAPIPLFDGSSTTSIPSRLEAHGINEDGQYFFQTNRFGFTQSPPPKTFSQNESDIIWRSSLAGGSFEQEVNANAGQPVGTPHIPIDFDYFDVATGSMAYVAEKSGTNGHQLAIKTPGISFPTLINQNAVATGNTDWFADGFGNQGSYVFTPSNDLYFQSVISTRNSSFDARNSIWQVTDQTPSMLNPIIQEGDIVPNHGFLFNIKFPTGGYSLQATPTGEVGFLADGGFFLGSAQGLAGQINVEKVVPEGVQISVNIGGLFLQNAILSNFDDLLIGPDGSIFFVADAQIRELPLPFEEATFIWRLGENDVPEAIVKSGTQADLANPLNGVFDTGFSLRDANSEGELLFAADLVRTGGVNSSNDDTLFLYRPVDNVLSGPDRVLIAREQDGVGPVARRGASLSDASDIAFLLADSNPLFQGADSIVQLASFFPDFNADFNFDGKVDADDLKIWEANFGTTSGATNMQGDADGDAKVEGKDFLLWQQKKTPPSGNLAKVPEPCSLGLLLVGAMLLTYSARKKGRLSTTALSHWNHNDTTTY